MADGGSGHRAWLPPADARPARESLAGYADLVEVGRGGDSIVYRARELALGREVAVKVLLVDDEERAARFAREVQITVDLGRQHPNIVTVLATGTTESGRPAIVMEYYDGGTLHDRLREFGPLPAHEVIRVGVILADALAFAHGRGVLHRDVKPQNVLVLPTSWVLADFGIARMVDAEHTSSVETFTYRHASPQILDGHPPTEADDVWSLGSTLYTLLDGRPPFASDDPDEDSALAYLRRARIEPHRPLDVPDAPGLVEVVERCLAKELDARWPSAQAVHEALLDLRQVSWEPGDAPSVRRAGAPAPTSTPADRTNPDHTNPDRTNPDHTNPGWAPSGPLRPDATAPRATRSTPGSVPAETEPPAADQPDPRSHETPAVALSAAHAVSAVPEIDLEPTGVGLPRADGSGAPEPRAAGSAVSAPAHASGEGRRRTILLLAVAAVVVGAALGVGGALLRGTDDPEAAATSPQGGAQAIPSLTAEPTESDPEPDVLDPELAFEIDDLRSDGGQIHVAWQDPSGGEAYFTISEVRPEQRFLYKFDAGRTDGSFDFPLGAGRTCFVMVSHMPDGSVGMSNRRCLTNRTS